MADTRPTWSYEPGEHLAVLGPRLAVVLPGDHRDLATRLWALVDEGADLVAVADVLAAGGLAALGGVAVVAWEGEDRVSVLARGVDPRVVVRTGDGTALVDGTTARTWVERSFERVRSVSVLAGDGRPPAADDDAVDVRAMTAGLVRVARLARTVTDPLADPGAEPRADPLAGPQDAAAVPSGPPAGPIAPVEGPVEPPQPTIPPSERAPLDDQPTEAHPAAVPASPPDPLPDLPPDPLPTGTSTVRGTPTLVVSDGRELAVDGVVVVGRSPGPRDRHAGAVPTLLRVESPQQEISGTHLEVRPGTGPDAGAAVVTDLGSTNGTVLEHPDRGPEALVPGVGVALTPGTVVHVGDGVTLRVTTGGDAVDGERDEGPGTVRGG